MDPLMLLIYLLILILGLVVLGYFMRRGGLSEPIQISVLLIAIILFLIYALRGKFF